MKFSIAACVFVLRGTPQSVSCEKSSFTVYHFAAMTVSAASLQLQCDHDQLVCPLQNITCQCTVVNRSSIAWSVDAEVVLVLENGEIAGNNANYPVTVKVLENGLLASNLSFIIAGSVTVQCLDSMEMSNQSYSITGTLLEVFVLPRYMCIRLSIKLYIFL